MKERDTKADQARRGTPGRIRWRAVREEFGHAVNVRTRFLFYTRYWIRKSNIETHEAISKAPCVPVDAFSPGIAFPRFRGFPVLSGADEAFIEYSKPDGIMEALACKLWIVEVFDIWESRYRTGNMRISVDEEVRYAIRPCVDALGDLRHICNNLVHGGIAREHEAANCRVLRWCCEGDRMQVRLGHAWSRARGRSRGRPQVVPGWKRVDA